MLYNIPIESIEWRYSKQWNEWFPDVFGRYGINHTTIYPEPLSGEIKNGSFLDVCVTHAFKSLQLYTISKFMYEGKIKDRDVFFFHDLWFPGVEMLAYMRDGLGIDFKICGILHAGSYDEHDFLYRKGMDYWAKWIERGWLEFFDAVFVATNFHKWMILHKRDDTIRPFALIQYPSTTEMERKIHVTGLPIYPEFVEQRSKRDIVVFPHRLDPEKNPQTFYDMMNGMPEDIIEKWLFYSTAQLCDTKQGYYDILNDSSISISFAEQETWGIAMVESVLCGCVPLVPNRLSYQELYSSEFRFDSLEECKTKLIQLITDEKAYKYLKEHTDLLAKSFKIDGARAIPNMLEVINKL
jgi:glycosyltransferase involved in cell wall biosynthesis